MSRAEEALLLARDHKEDNRGAETVVRHDVGEFQDRGGARGVVVRARRRAARVQDVGHAGVIVAADDDRPAGGVGTGQRGHDVRDLGPLRNPGLDPGLVERVELHPEPVSRLRGRAGEFRADPGRRAAYPVAARERVGERVARLEARQDVDGPLDPIGRNRLDDVADVRIRRRRRDIRGAGPRMPMPLQ
jgi:hypothetical protein